MQRKEQHTHPQIPYQWITDSIADLFAPIVPPEDSGTNSDTGSAPETLDTELPWEDPPEQQPGISLKLTRAELCTDFRLWSESTATSPPGRHLRHYTILV